MFIFTDKVKPGFVHITSSRDFDQLNARIFNTYSDGKINEI